MFQILFIHSSVDGYSSCFYLLAVVNDATMNIDYKYLFEFLFSIILAMYLAVKLLGLMLIYV